MNTLAKASLLIVLGILLQGCDSVLERPDPSTSVSQETALSSADAAQGIRASMFDWFHDAQLSTDWLLGPSALADNTYFRGNQQRHQGLNVNNRRAGVGTGAWDEIYDVINDANLLIHAIEEDVLPPDVDNKLKAEARFMRALAYHHAVRTFGYDPDGQGGVVSPNSGPGADFDLGVVLKTTPTLEVSDATGGPRSTVPEVYDQILTDLNEASSLYSNLPSDVKENSSFYPSQAAVQALLARVQLYRRNWDAANTAAQNAIDQANSSFGSSLAPADSAGLRSIFDETTGNNPEAIFTIDTDPATESAGINNSIAAYTSVQYQAQLPTQDLIDQYETGDARRAAWFDPCYDDYNEEVKEGCDLINDNGYELTKYSAEQGVSRFADDYVHLRIAEMYLIQAEARLNVNGVSSAISRLNDLRSERGASQLNPANYDFDSAYDEILAERRRELVAEGHRFFDLKRLGRDIRKVQGRNDIPFNDIRILDDLPPSELEVNEDLVQNPGYR